VLKVGDKAPTISLSGDDGKTHDVKTEGRTVVVYFYPKDDTPGCTVEAKDFSTDDAQSRLERAGVTVYGISKDTVQSHGKFRDKHGLRVRLLSDPELKVHTAFGAYGEKTMYGRKVMGTIRSTFVLRDGRVTHAYPTVKVPGHVEAVLTALEGGRPAAKAAPKAPTKSKAADDAPAKKATAKKATAKKATAKKA